jgi:O-antigen/teichoic acid export membrane protein
LLAGSIPLVTITSGLRGILEAQQRFRVVTLIRIPMSVFSFLGPLLVLPFSRNLVPVVLVLIGGRLVACFAHLLACFRGMPGLRHVSFERSVLRPVFSFGGWITIIGLVAPMMLYVDRFMVSALLSVAMVAYYTAPFDVLVRLTMIPGGVAGVLFPAFAVSLAQDRDRTGVLINRAVKYILLTLFPIILIIVTLASEGLRLWLGPAFAQNGTAVMRWLAAGILVNGVATVPFILIQSAGRPSLVAKAETAQLPLYIIAIWLLTMRFGIVGTAIAWTGRVTIDAIILFACSHRVLPHKPGFLWKLGIATTGMLAVLGLALLPETLLMKAAFLGVTLLIFVVAALRWGLGSSERAFLAGASPPAQA